MKCAIQKLCQIAAGALVFGAAVALLLLPSPAGAQELNLSTGEQKAHILLTPQKSADLRTMLSANGPNDLTYHGGPVMTSANTYAIYWIPSHLQNGAATGVSSNYENITTALLQLYPGHGIDNNSTQYYETTRYGFFSWTDYVQNTGKFVASYVDTDPFPASGCDDYYTPGNCLTDSQIQAEILKVMTLKGWTGGLNNIFFMYTSSGEGSCAGGSCAYSDYCAYHSYFNNGSTPVLYGNMPYSDPNLCQVYGTPSPNGDAAGDAAANVTSHELTEAITDPEISAWLDASGNEIGDKCAWNFGTNTWDSGKANESWPVAFSPFYIIGHPPVSSFELQMEYDNHSSSCVQVGP